MTDPMALDPDSICRCCLSDRRDTLRSIFDANIRDMFVACTRLRVNEADGLPGRICSLCVFKCISWSSFKQLCERSEEMLRTQFNIQAEVEDIPTVVKNEDRYPVINNVSVQSPLQQQTTTPHEKEDVVITRIFSREVVIQNHKKAPKKGIEKNGLGVIETKSDRPSASEIDVDEDFTGFALIDDEVATNDNQREQESENSAEDDAELVTIADDNMEYLDDLTDDDNGGEDAATDCLNDGVLNNPPKSAKQRTLFSSPKSRFSCDECNLHFKSQDRLDAHRRTHLGEKPEVCPICDKGFNHIRALRRHQAIHTYEGEMFTCADCGKSYKYRTSLKLHQKSHQNGKCFVCELCGKSFNRVHGLQSHMLTHSSATPFACDQCDKRFKNEVMLRNHQLRHEAIKKFACELCSKSFATTSELMIHGRMHSGQKPFVCSHCDKAYKTQSHLTAHVRTHTGERPYACDMCDQKFTLRKILNQHRLVHTGERPHICNICERPFRQLSTLKVHLRTHKSLKEADTTDPED